MAGFASQERAAEKGTGPRRVPTPPQAGSLWVSPSEKSLQGRGSYHMGLLSWVKGKQNLSRELETRLSWWNVCLKGTKP